VPDSRKLHKNLIPRLGGAAIFSGIIVAISYNISLFFTQAFFYLFIALILLFVTGIKDDVKGMRAMDKFYIQIIAAFLAVYGGIRIESLYGVFEIYELPVGVQYILSIIVIVGITNAYNLMDGIDGLAGGIGFINLLVLAGMFLYSGNMPFAILCLIFAGSILGFLMYNFQPAKIFMGDGGALLIGFIMVVMGISLINSNINVSSNQISNVVIIVGSIMLIPVFDTLRVFVIRLMNKRSPFTPDKNHLHHILISKGYNHMKSSVILYLANIVIIILGFLLKDITFSKSIVNLFFLVN
jgi:UDP-N-acetylmuramyl pentapeptide phosphotransferase/UDP-N-acetylglucosamine-1-phosphate transferase